MTIPAPHQLRVLNEEAELAERHAKLYEFLTSEKIQSVPQDERVRLTEQLQHMYAYLTVLRERIAHF